MANAHLADHGPFRTASARLPGLWTRALVVAGLVLLTLAVVGSVKLIEDETVETEQHSHEKRQFQLGGMFAGHANQASRSAASPDGIADCKAPGPETSNAGAETADSSDAQSSTDGPRTTRIDDVTETGHAQSVPQALLEALTEALKGVIKGPPPPSDTGPTKTTKAFLLTSSPRKTGKAAGSSAASSSAASAPGPQPGLGLLSGLLGGLVGRDGEQDAIQHGVAAQLRARGEAGTPGEQIRSLLSPMSTLVAQVVDIDAGAAVRLTDVVLSALPVDASAVASAIPRVAEQRSAKASDMIPLILPAVSAALGKELDTVVPVDVGDLPKALGNVVTQGTIVINSITSTTRGADMDAGLQEILDQVAEVVYAAADSLGEPLCAISQNVQGVPLEAVLPCSSAGKGPVSVDIITLNPETGATEAVPADSATWNVIPVASAPVYSSVQIPSPAAASPTSTTSLGTPPGTSTAADPGTRPQTVGRPQSSEEAPGPCPGQGFKCSKCLDGWFCPPQETPAQVVPCGLGWPCFHCDSGWFCASEEPQAPAATLPPTTPATQSPTPLVATPGTQGSADGGNAADATPAGNPVLSDWAYLGCFRDAINRTLRGSRPLDYLRGQMSKATCIGHCAARGYPFAGTEYGKECWCGSSIQDDAVRLPEGFCDTPCQGADELCGGSWAVSVFMCPGEPGSGLLPGQLPAQRPASSQGQASPEAPPGQLALDGLPPADQTPTAAAPAQTDPKNYGPLARLLLDKALLSR